MFKDCTIGEVGDVDCFSNGKKIPIELKANSAGPDDIGRVKVEEMMKVCGYVQVKKPREKNAFAAYAGKEFDVSWQRLPDNNPDGARK